MVAVIEKAIREGIHIVKLPPHVTDKLQLLDVTCVSPLKGYWEKSLNDFVSSFGFTRTGIYLLDREKFHIARLDARLIRRYTKCLEMGKPSDMFKEASQSVETLQKLKPTAEERNDNATENIFQLQELPVNFTPITNVTITNNDDSSINNVASNSSTSKLLPINTIPLVDHECDRPISRRIVPMPHKIPGKVWVPGSSMDPS